MDNDQNVQNPQGENNMAPAVPQEEAAAPAEGTAPEAPAQEEPQA